MLVLDILVLAFLFVEVSVSSSRTIVTQRTSKPVKMPTLVIYTNVAKDKIPADFLTKATDVLAKQLGKPQKVRNFK